MTVRDRRRALCNISASNKEDRCTRRSPVSNRIPKQETLDILEDTELEIELLLRQEHDIRDITGREVMDAVLRVAAEEPDAVVNQIIAERDGHSDE